MKKIIITGANGFIGSNILMWFEKTKDLEPIGMVRKKSNLTRLKNSNSPILTYPDTRDGLVEILKGAVGIVNTAGKASYKGRYEDFYNSNVQFPLELIDAAIRAGVEKFIHIGSTVIYGFKGNINTTEDKNPEPYKNPYCITKKICEEKLLEYSDRIEIYIFRPATVYGPWDFSFTFSLLSSLEKGLRVFPGGGKTLTSPCYVKNLAYATECAIFNKGNSGAYNISDGNDMKWIDFLTLFSSELSVRPPKLGIPTLPLFFIFKLLECTEKLTGITLPEAASTALIVQVSKDYSFSIEKAKNKLHYKAPYSTIQGVKESVLWYLEQKSKMPSQESP